MKIWNTHPTAALALLAVITACQDQPTAPDHISTAPAIPIDMAAGASTTLIAAGDIAGCASSYRDKLTAKLIERIGGAVLTLGDNAYPDGSAANFRCYSASWGKFKAATHPAPGNHDYHIHNAAGYFSYFGRQAGPAGRGYYSFDLGGWHLISLNSERNLAAEASWLRGDLSKSRSKCTLAYWHKPLFTSGAVHPPETAMRPIFTILYNAGADVVLSAHNHQYERFGPQNPNGRADAHKGIVQFVVGTGGSASLYNFGPPRANSQARFKGYGVLKLQLQPDRFTYTFIALNGRFTDSGTRNCH